MGCRIEIRPLHRIADFNFNPGVGIFLGPDHDEATVGGANPLGAQLQRHPHADGGKPLQLGLVIDFVGNGIQGLVLLADLQVHVLKITALGGFDIDGDDLASARPQPGEDFLVPGRRPARAFQRPDSPVHLERLVGDRNIGRHQAGKSTQVAFDGQRKIERRQSIHDVPGKFEMQLLLLAQWNRVFNHGVRFGGDELLQLGELLPSLVGAAMVFKDRNGIGKVREVQRQFTDDKGMVSIDPALLRRFLALGKNRGLALTDFIHRQAQLGVFQLNL
mmetsp:Transcript_31892/g.74828  ORF Transcript_31892/g.74828 Transcript_31892/m.74828 type:complete len:275 (+) Transcript_31892:3727-4551(+)